MEKNFYCSKCGYFGEHSDHEELNGCTYLAAPGYAPVCNPLEHDCVWCWMVIAIVFNAVLWFLIGWAWEPISATISNAWGVLTGF